MRFYCMKKLYFYPCIQLKHFVIIPVLIFRTAALGSFRKKYYMLAVICWFRNTIFHMLIKLPGHITQNIHFRDCQCVSRWIPTDQSLNLSERSTVHSQPQRLLSGNVFIVKCDVTLKLPSKVKRSKAGCNVGAAKFSWKYHSSLPSVTVSPNSWMWKP